MRLLYYYLQVKLTVAKANEPLFIIHDWMILWSRFLAFVIRIYRKDSYIFALYRSPLLLYRSPA